MSTPKRNVYYTFYEDRDSNDWSGIANADIEDASTNILIEMLREVTRELINRGVYDLNNPVEKVNLSRDCLVIKNDNSFSIGSMQTDINTAQIEYLADVLNQPTDDGTMLFQIYDGAK